MTDAILSVRGLSVSAGTAATIVADVGFDVRAGEITGLSGPPGSGKSTLAHALLGLTARGLSIAAGEVRLRGEDLLRVAERRRSELLGGAIALVTQNPRRALHPMLTIGRQIERIAARHAVSGRGTAVKLLQRVGINAPEQRVGAFAHELSGGMAQRALIAMALSGRPGVLVADEPTSGLDVTVQAQLLDWLRDLCRSDGLAVVLATQEPGILLNYCDRVLVLDHGRLVADLDHEAYAATLQTGGVPGPRPVQTAAGDEPIAEVTDLVRTYPLRGSRKRVHAVGGVSLAIPRGTTLGLIGESGSGKTTVGRCLAGLESVSGGAVGFRGRALGDYSRRELCARLQFVRQDPFDSFDPRMRIVDSVQQAVRLHTGLARAEARRAALGVLERAGVDAPAAEQKPERLSAGTLQKANIARALAVEPELLVLDEPTAVLSPGDRDELTQLLHELLREKTLSCLLISHDLTTVAAVCDRLAVMYLGQIVESGPASQVFAAPAHPYTRALLAAHLGTDPATARRQRPPEVTLEGDIPSPIDLPPGCYLATRCPAAVDRCHQQRQTLSRHDGERRVRCWRAAPPAAATGAPPP